MALKGKIIGGALINITFYPGAVAAGTSISLTNICNGMSRILRCTVYTGSDGTAAAVGSNKTVVSTAPVAGQVHLYDKSNIRLGDATNTRDFIMISGYSAL